MQSKKDSFVEVTSGALKKPTVAIFVTSLLVFMAVRSSLLWDIVGVKRAATVLLSSLWGFFYQIFGENHFYINVVGSSVVPVVVYIASNVFFTYLDLTGKPAALLKYKIQEEKCVPVNWIKYKRALKLIAINLFVIGPLLNLLLYPLIVWRGVECGYELPSLLTAVWHLFCCVAVEEIGFYYCHRLLHHPKLYKHCHKIHHEWTAPTGIVSIYSHPIEYIVAVTWPIWFGPFLMGSHLSIAWLWYVISGVSTTVSHSGYHFPFFPSNEAHDFHHQKFTTNYGVRGIMDRLHGTDETFRRSKSYNRNIILFGFTSAREMFPDSLKQKQNGQSSARGVHVPAVNEVSYPS